MQTSCVIFASFLSCMFITIRGPSGTLSDPGSSSSPSSSFSRLLLLLFLLFLLLPLPESWSAKREGQLIRRIDERRSPIFYAPAFSLIIFKLISYKYYSFVLASIHIYLSLEIKGSYVFLTYIHLSSFALLSHYEALALKWRHNTWGSTTTPAHPFFSFSILSPPRLSAS